MDPVARGVDLAALLLCAEADEREDGGQYPPPGPRRMRLGCATTRSNRSR